MSYFSRYGDRSILFYISLWIGNMEDAVFSETQHLNPESSTPRMMESENTQGLECCCLLITLGHPWTLESLTPWTLSPN